MPLSALTWKALRPVNDTWNAAAAYSSSSDAGTLEGIFITAIEQLFASGKTYLDGTNRIPGQGIAWTTSRLSDNSLTIRPVTTSGKIPQLVHMTGLYAGGAVSGLPSLPYSFLEGNYPTRGKVVSTLVLNPGSFAGNTSTPFGSTSNGSAVRHMGYYVCSPCDTTAGNNNTNGLLTYNIRNLNFRAWESQDAILIHIFCPQTSNGSFLLYGGWMAPDPNTAGPNDAESDGIIYGIATSGNGVTSAYNSYSSLLSFHSGGNFFTHAVTPTAGTTPFIWPHTAVFSPGTSTVLTVNRMGTYSATTPPLVTLSNKVVKMPIYFYSSNNFIGRAREMWMFQDTINGFVLRSGGSGGIDKAWVASGHNTVAYDSLLLSI